MFTYSLALKEGDKLVSYPTQFPSRFYLGRKWSCWGGISAISPERHHIGERFRECIIVPSIGGWVRGGVCTPLGVESCSSWFCIEEQELKRIHVKRMIYNINQEINWTIFKHLYTEKKADSSQKFTTFVEYCILIHIIKFCRGDWTHEENQMARCLISCILTQFYYHFINIIERNYYSKFPILLDINNIYSILCGPPFLNKWYFYMLCVHLETPEIKHSTHQKVCSCTWKPECELLFQ